MTLRMGDGPVANLPAGLDAYAGYTDDSGIGETYPAVVAAFPDAIHFSITTKAGFPAQCADVENGAMSSWAGFDWGYCEVSQVNSLVALDGRPKRLWTAHRDPKLGKHICSPLCWPGLVTTADGTQWTNHGGAWDESVLSDDFFDLSPPPPNPPTEEEPEMLSISADGKTVAAIRSDGHLIVATAPWTAADLYDITDHGQAVNPGGGPWTFPTS